MFSLENQQTKKSLKKVFDGLFKKYGRDFDEHDDEIDLESMEVVKKGGHLEEIDRIKFGNAYGSGLARGAVNNNTDDGRDGRKMAASGLDADIEDCFTIEQENMRTINPRILEKISSTLSTPTRKEPLNKQACDSAPTNKQETSSDTPIKRPRGRPRKYPKSPSDLPEHKDGKENDTEASATPKTETQPASKSENADGQSKGSIDSEKCNEDDNVDGALRDGNDDLLDPPIKRKRGRPRKYPLAEPLDTSPPPTTPKTKSPPDSRKPFDKNKTERITPLAHKLAKASLNEHTKDSKGLANLPPDIINLPPKRERHKPDKYTPEIISLESSPKSTPQTTIQAGASGGEEIAKRGRGRPRKYPIQTSSPKSTPISTTTTTTTVDLSKHKGVNDADNIPPSSSHHLTDRGPEETGNFCTKKIVDQKEKIISKDFNQLYAQVFEQDEEGNDVIHISKNITDASLNNEFKSNPFFDDLLYKHVFA